MQRTTTPRPQPEDPRPGSEQRRQPELLAPAGGFEAAAYAFEAGADAVYLGLTDFSARKGAPNFSIESLRRLKSLALERGRRVYVTVNTVIREEELERLAESLGWLEALAVDGVFIQDPGVWRLLRRHFPALPVIASTQMAVHNGAGIRALQELGFRRVILPRELPLESIRRLRAEHPDMELEVFIHGALCYSYSGLCLASGLLAGRSGNRGECAQLCRNLYSEGERRGYLLSCRDLAAEEAVLELAAIGVDAFKIEGRLKSPEYVYHAVRYYRRLLDSGGRLPEPERRELARRRDLGFAREHTRGWLRERAGSRLIDTGYAMHRGAALGRVQEACPDSFTLTVEADLSVRDGLAWFPADDPGNPVIFSVQRMWPAAAPQGRAPGPPAAERRSGREASFCRAGDTVRIELPEEARRSAARRPAVGQEIRQLSSRFLDLPQVKETSWRPWRVPLAARLRLRAEGGGRSGELGCEAQLMGRPFRFARAVEVQRAERARPFAPLLEALLAEAGDCPLVLQPVRFENGSGLPDDRIFVPPSVLKRVKNELYGELERHLERALRERAAAAARDVEGEAVPVPPAAPLPSGERGAFARRERFTSGELPFAELPFAEPPAGGGGGAARAAPAFDPDGLAVIGGLHLLPLPPLAEDEERLFGAVEALVDAHPGRTFALGFNNIGHLQLARRLAGRPNVRWFVDFFAYVANRQAWRFYVERLPGLLFLYSWIEGSEADHRALQAALPGEGPPLLRPAPAFRPPLMVSMGCHARHVAGRSCRPDCPRDFRFPLRQGRTPLVAVVRDCVTYLFRAEPGQERSSPSAAADRP